MKIIDGKLIYESEDIVKVFKLSLHRNPYFINSQVVKVCSYKEFKEQYKNHYEYSEEDYLNGYGCSITYNCEPVFTLRKEK